MFFALPLAHCSTVRLTHQIRADGEGVTPLTVSVGFRLAVDAAGHK